MNNRLISHFEINLYVQEDFWGFFVSLWLFLTHTLCLIHRRIELKIPCGTVGSMALLSAEVSGIVVVLWGSAGTGMVAPSVLVLTALTKFCCSEPDPLATGTPDGVLPPV